MRRDRARWFSVKAIEVTDLVAGGKIRPVVDRVYPLAEGAEAHQYVESGHKRGGVAIILGDRERTSSQLLSPK